MEQSLSSVLFPVPGAANGTKTGKFFMLGIRRSLLQGLNVELQAARLLRLSNYEPEIGGTNLDSSGTGLPEVERTHGRELFLRTIVVSCAICFIGVARSNNLQVFIAETQFSAQPSLLVRSR